MIPTQSKLITQREIYLMTAHSLGYWHGRDQGIESNPYDSEDNPYLYAAYRLGYDCGISDYCRDNHPEDEAA